MISKIVQNFDILITSLSALHNYFDSPTKLFLFLYLNNKEKHRCYYVIHIVIWKNHISYYFRRIYNGWKHAVFVI